MKTILVVDDMAIFREPIEAILRAEGYTVLTASDGMEAIAAISRQAPDLVLLDLGMPVMSGLMALKKLRADPATSRIPVIVLSAETDRLRIVDAVKLGISGYLLKSQFSLKAMLERVNNALAMPASEGRTTPTVIGEASCKPAKTIAQADPAQSLSERQKTPPGVSGNPGKTGSTAQKPSALHADRSAGRGAPKGRKQLSAGTDLSSLQPLLSRSALVERVAAEGELTGFSPTVSQVLKITSSERCSMDQVSKAVSQDHAMALKVLKLANSSVYSRGDRVDSVHKAVLRIGMQSIRQAVLNIGIVERFGSLAFEDHLNTPLFWEHSIACGIVAAELAHALKHKEPDIAFTAGLLHDLGRVIYADRLGEQYVEVLNVAHALELPLEQVESRLLLISHSEIMDRVLHAWRFPKELVNPIVHHHAKPGDVKALAPHQAADVLCLGLADRLAHALMLGSSGNDTIYPTEEHCRLLGLEPSIIRKIEETAREQTDDTKFALLSQSNGAAWPRCFEQRRSELKAPFRPLYLSASPEIDAFRIFCNALAGDAGGERPNVAVVHIAAAKERRLLSERLAGMEEEAGVSALPMIILSPSGQLVLEGEAGAGRACEKLSTPTPISRFIASVNAVLGNGSLQRAA